MFVDELKQIKAEGELVSIFKDRDSTKKFDAGYVVGVSEQLYVLASVTPEGDFDGFKLSRINIFQIVRGGFYNEKLIKLVSIKKTKSNISFESDDLVKELLGFALKEKRIVSIELIDSGFDDCIGLIVSVDESMCRIQQIDEYGEPDGVSLIQLSDITKIACDVKDDRYLLLLYSPNERPTTM